MKKVLLIIALILISVGLYNKYDHLEQPDIPNISPVIPQPSPPPPPKPILENNIIHDNLELAKNLRDIHKKKLLLIVGADWCPFCKKLKHDLEKFNTSQYIICIVDLDNNKELASKYKLKNLPTSILLDNENNEVCRKTGYIHQEYQKWLDSN